MHKFRDYMADVLMRLGQSERVKAGKNGALAESP